MRRNSGRPCGWFSVVLRVVLAALLGCSQNDADPEHDAGDAVADVGDTPEEQLEPGVPPVDLLVLVDNSGSMAQEQAALTLRLGELLEELVHPTDRDGDGALDHPPVTDIHLGVVTSDLGAGGYAITTCEDEPVVGDDGCLHNEAAPAVGGCDIEYPTWLTWRVLDEATYSVEQLAGDFTCIGTIQDTWPMVGCGWEQPLEALRRALTTQQAAGGCNEGFLRPDSLLVLIVLTDEDDASVDPAHYEMLDPEHTELGHLNIRAFLHPEMLTPVEEYVAAFRALRPEPADGPGRFLVGLLIGVPPGPECDGPGDLLDGCLALPEMQERIDPAAPTQLIVSCNTAMGISFPPVRLVRLARQFGDDAYVGSICTTDYAGTIRGITDAIVERLR